jgi:hypothetical protein
MSTPSIKVGQGNWGIKTGNLLAYANTDKKFVARDFTVGRLLNTATRVNASGNIEAVSANVPRIDYFGGQASLLVEPAATNTLSGSVSLDTGWTITADTTVTSGIVSPSGSTNATLFQASSFNSRVRQVATLTSGTTYTFSCFGKFGALSSGFSLNVFDENAASYGSGVCQAFNLNEGTLGASGTIGAGFTLQSVGMEDYGNGWYRCRMTVLMGYTPTAPRVGFRIGTQITGRPASVPGGTVNAWGAQLETGSVATSYIPTTTGSVTRNADAISLTGVAGLIGQTEGTIYAEFFIDFNNRDADILSLDGGSTSDGFFMSIRNSSVVQLIVRTASANALIFQRAGAYPTGVNKLAVAYKNGDFAICLNGTTVQTDTSSITMPSVSINRAGLGQNRLYSLNQQLRIRAASIYQTRLPNTTTDGSPSLQSITTL